MDTINEIKLYEEPKYSCPIHGIVEVWSSSIKNHDGHWCMTCWIEWMDKNITRASKINKVKNNRMSNLQTLCLCCHGKKDNPSTIPL